MRQSELTKQEERKKEREMLAMKKEVDLEFAKNEEEKRFRQLKEKKQLADFHLRQTVSLTFHIRFQVMCFVQVHLAVFITGAKGQCVISELNRILTLNTEN